MQLCGTAVAKGSNQSGTFYSYHAEHSPEQIDQWFCALAPRLLKYRFDTITESFSNGVWSTLFSIAIFPSHISITCYYPNREAWRYLWWRTLHSWTNRAQRKSYRWRERYSPWANPKIPFLGTGSTLLFIRQTLLWAYRQSSLSEFCPSSVLCRNRNGLFSRRRCNTRFFGQFTVNLWWIATADTLRRHHLAYGALSDYILKSENSLKLLLVFMAHQYGHTNHLSTVSDKAFEHQIVQELVTYFASQDSWNCNQSGRNILLDSLDFYYHPELNKETIPIVESNWYQNVSDVSV